jgi:uncharacterized protein YgbK (DUF1537 family)
MPGTSFTNTDGYDVIATNTQSRQIPPKKAAQVVRSELKKLQAMDIRVLFKKIDTTLRGNIAEEISAIMDEGFLLTIMVVAIPRIGRTTHGGRQYFEGKPIEETILTKDRLNPTPFVTSCIPQLFESYRDIETQTIDIPAIRSGHFSLTLFPLTSGKKKIFIFDAETMEDINFIVQTALQSGIQPILFAGSLGLMESLAKLLKEEIGIQKNQSILFSGEKVLIACGSSHPVSRAQVQTLFANRNVLSLPLQYKDIKQITQSRTQSIHCLYIPPSISLSAKEIERNFSKLTAEAIQTGNYNYLIIIGGETAFSVCRKLHIYEIELLATYNNIAAISIPKGEPSLPPIIIITKGGSVGDQSFLLNLSDRILKGDYE